MRRLRDALGEPLFVVLVLLPAVLFRRALTDGTFFFRDLHLFAFPQRVKVGAALREGGLPLWDATLHAGQPLLANPNNTALYPTALLYAVVPAVTAFNVEILLHVALAGAGMYLLARALRLPPVAAFVAGMAYAFSGPVLSLTNLLNRHLATAWTPFAVLFWYLFLARRKPFWFACTAVVVALQLLAGFPELSLAVGVLLALWTAVTPAARPSPGARVGLFALLIVAASGLAAPQILPASRLLPGTIRGHGIMPASVLDWSVDPRRLPELAVPGLFGRVDALDDRAYLGRAIEDLSFPYVVSLTFGVGALALAALALRGSEALPRRASLALAGFAGGAVILSLGRHLPGAVALIGALPRLPLRYPEKFVSIAAFPVALLAGAGLERLLAGGASGRIFARASAGLAALLGGLAALEAFVPGFRRRIATGLFGLDERNVPSVQVAAAFLLAAFAAAGIGLAAAAAFGGRVRIAGVLACVAVAVPLIVQARGLAPIAPRALFDEPPAVASVRTAVGRGFLYRVRAVGPVRVEGQSDDIAWYARSDMQRLVSYVAAGYGIPVAFNVDFDGLAGIYEMRVALLIESLPWDKRVAALAAAGVTAVLADEPLPVSGLRRVESPAGLYLYQVAGARPVAWLEGAGEKGGVEEISLGPARRSFRTFSSHTGTLIVSTPWSEGWSALIDGRPAPVLRANTYMQSVAVPAGEHVVALSYRPPGLAWGLGLAGLTGAALAAALVRGRRVSEAAG